MARYVEQVFRHWKRFVAILILLPTPISLGVLVYFRTYTATTDIWVEAPTNFGSSVQISGWNQYLTPAQNETDSLNQLLLTKAFTDSVVDRVASSGNVPNADERAQALLAIGKDLKVAAVGSHLVTVTFSCDHPMVCTSFLTATIDAFQAQLTDSLKAQQQLSTAFIQSQLDTAQARQATSQTDLQRYLLGHPGAVSPKAGESSGDLQLDQLALRAQQDRENVAQLQTQLAAATYTFAAAEQFIKTNTKVVDQPAVTRGGLTGDGSSIRRALLVWGISFGAAFIYLLLLVLLDKAAMDPQELERRLRLPVLTTIPRLARAERQ
jgi:capsular polysaccharide biosynthesis protein